MFSKIAIIGPGLLGGSLAKCLVSQGKTVKLWSRTESKVEKLNKIGVANFVSNNLSKVVDDVELIVLATPVGVMPTIVSEIANVIDSSEKVFVTDVGSVKAKVCHDLEAICSNARNLKFVGSHPMAGSEKAGIENASETLFEGASCIVTPVDGKINNDTQMISEFWQSVGCSVFTMTPSEHDEKISAVSHIPHIAAVVTILTALEGDTDRAKLSGQGLRDTTRIAGGSETLWSEILMENVEKITPFLSDFKNKISVIEEFLEKDDKDGLEEVLKKAKELKEHASRVHEQ